jgi:hypothetical protein
MVTLEYGDIVETVFYKASDEDLTHKIWCDDAVLATLTDFCIDRLGNVRKGKGIVNMMGEAEEFNPDFVPALRWSMSQAPWNSHDTYVEMYLPNPITSPALYAKIRSAMLTEFLTRLKAAERKVKRRKS